MKKTKLEYKLAFKGCNSYQGDTIDSKPIDFELIDNRLMRIIFEEPSIDFVNYQHEIEVENSCWNTKTCALYGYGFFYKYKYIE